MRRRPVLLSSALVLVTAGACKREPGPGQPSPVVKRVPVAAAHSHPPAAPEEPAKPPPDPKGGSFSLKEATAGLPGAGKLMASLEMTQDGKPLGVFHCELFEHRAPLAVANFVGLARGLRPFLDVKTGIWTTRPFYDGIHVHRVVPDFMIQMGDPFCLGDRTCGGKGGTGDPGYTFDDELEGGLRMDRGGLLAMANRGPSTNGSQFFITEKEAPWLSGHHTIFGSCDNVALVKKIASVERGPRDLPVPAIAIARVVITRKR